MSYSTKEKEHDGRGYTRLTNPEDTKILFGKASSDSGKPLSDPVDFFIAEAINGMADS